MDVEVRPYRSTDLEAVTRIWREVGWIDDTERKAQGLATVLGLGAAHVAAIDGEAECLVHRTPGTVRYDRTDLPLCAITGVTTSAIGRGLGLATRLTADALAAGAQEGAAVAALGMFEQGFYNKVGMGTLSYLGFLNVDPSRLRVAAPARRPVRVTREQWPEVADLMARRARRHGGVTLDPPEVLRAEADFVDDPYLGLGFRRDGRLSACLLGTLKDENGPLRVALFAYEGDDDLRDLLGLLRSLSDQVHRVVMPEPPGIQLQDVVDRPIRDADPEDPSHSLWFGAAAFYQARILDLPACIGARTWPGEPVSFDLTLTDPLSDLDLPWPGLAGDHTVTVGPTSSVEPGHRGDLPVLRASVSALSRMWFGVRPATGLAITDDIEGPRELLEALDDVFVLPPALPGLAF
jgi:hypothetical protein